MKPKATITRLANAPQGEPYKIESIEGLAPDIAQQQAAKWWESGGTLAVIVNVNGTEDSRYERTYLDAARIPKGWQAREQPISKRPVAEILKTEPDLKKPPPVNRFEDSPRTAQAAPTLFNPSEKPKPVQGQPAPGVGACWTCGGPAGSHDAHMRPIDRTPAGRLDALRCPECGRQQQAPYIRRAELQLRYLRAQSKRAQADQALTLKVGKR